MTVAVNELWTGVAALATILFGIRVNRRVAVLSQYSIPPAVSGGLLMAVLLAVLGVLFDIKLTFADTLRNSLLLVFFASLGLTAKFRQLRSGGGAVAGLCGFIALLAFSQSAIGVAIASAFGRPPALGVFLGSVPFLGGHGTVVAWPRRSMRRTCRMSLRLAWSAPHWGWSWARLCRGWLARNWPAAWQPSRATP